jgi:hypothetical protein
MVWIVAALMALSLGAPALAQVMGEEAEMERLQAKADEAIANSDADGAAMNMGKAALMAAQIAKRGRDAAASQWYRGLEALFRAQEEAYRGQALFVRAGGTLPASSGVCGSLALAKQHIGKSAALLADAVSPAGTPAERATHVHAAVTEWTGTIDGMIGDFQCR